MVGIGTSLLQIFSRIFFDLFDKVLWRIFRYTKIPLYSYKQDLYGDIVCTCTVRHILSILTMPKDSPVSIYCRNTKNR